MVRLARLADIPQLLEIRDGPGENGLTDPGPVSEADAVRFIANRTLWVWQEDDGAIAGFAGSDTDAGSIWALLVAPGHEGKGIGRALLATACDKLREAGHRSAWLTTAAGSRAERHYRAAGWIASGDNQKGKLLLQKPL